MKMKKWIFEFHILEPRSKEINAKKITAVKVETYSVISHFFFLLLEKKKENLHALQSTIFITEDKRVDAVWSHYFLSS